MDRPRTSDLLAAALAERNAARRELARATASMEAVRDQLQRLLDCKSHPEARRVLACVGACLTLPTSALEVGALESLVDRCMMLVSEERQRQGPPVTGCGCQLCHLEDALVRLRGPCPFPGGYRPRTREQRKAG
jgi:hypothetical protein